MEVDVLFETNGETARIKCVSGTHVAVNDRVIAPDEVETVQAGDRISLGDRSMLWRCAPARAPAAGLEASKPRVPGAWAWRTLLQGTALVIRKPSAKVDADFAAPCPDVPHLHVFRDGAEETVKSLSTGSEAREGKVIWEIGSAPDCPVRLNQSGVSRFHASLKREGDTWSVTDELSVNGVYVNGAKTFNAFLDSGDVINIAGSRLVIHVNQQSPSGPPVRVRWLVACAAFVITCVAFVLIRLWLKR